MRFCNEIMRIGSKLCVFVTKLCELCEIMRKLCEHYAKRFWNYAFSFLLKFYNKVVTKIGEFITVLLKNTTEIWKLLVFCMFFFTSKSKLGFWKRTKIIVLFGKRGNECWTLTKPKVKSLNNLFFIVILMKKSQ